MANLYRVFRDLILESPLLVGKVTAMQAGRCAMSLPTDGAIFASSVAAVGQPVFEIEI